MMTEATNALRERRECVEITLQYVEHERRLLAIGTDCAGDTVHRKRAWLLDEVTEWYRAELQELDCAIASGRHDSRLATLNAC